jgi:tripartite ATP-independent transporter DctP family solute receptor
MIKKAVGVLCIIAVIVTLVAGCGSSTSQSETSGESAGIEKVTLIFGATMDDSGQDREITQYFKKRLSELSDGNMDVEIYLGGQLGSEREVLEQMKMGETDLSYGVLPPELYFQEYCAISVPFLFPNFDSINEYFEAVLEDIKPLASTKGGIIPLALHSSGTRWTTSNKPFYSAAEMKGLKLRLPEIEWWIKVWAEMGALPTPIAATEIVTALQTGVVDAQENTLTNIVGRQMWEYQKYLIKTDHVNWWQMWTISEKTWNKLSENQQNILLQAIKETTERNNKMVEEMNKEFVQKCLDEGMELIELDRNDLFEAALPAIEKIAQEELNKEAYELAIKIIEKYQ